MLHGFYNYQHLLLGPVEMGVQEKSEGVYLGVPGVYYERENMVAGMFGFDLFRCKGTKITGTFGYYLRKIVLIE